MKDLVHLADQMGAALDPLFLRQARIAFAQTALRTLSEWVVPAPDELIETSNERLARMSFDLADAMLAELARRERSELGGDA